MKEIRPRRRSLSLFLALLVSVLLAPVLEVDASGVRSAEPGSSGPETVDAPAPMRGLDRLSVAELRQLRQQRIDQGSESARWPNPYLSFLPAGAEPDLGFWWALLDRQAEERRQRMRDRASGEDSVAPLQARTLVINETEANDTAATANFLAGFGSGTGEDPAVDVRGQFSLQAAPSLLGPFPEDDGSLALATALDLGAGQAVRISGTIGDGPHGSSGSGSGDFDIFRISGVTAGQQLLIDVDTPLPFGNLDPFIGVYDAAGNLLALNEDGDALSFDSYLVLPASVTGDYYVAVSGSLFPFASVLIDPFDSGSGTGAGSEGDYEITIGLDYGDADWFSVDLEACDILGVNLLASGNQVQLQSPDGNLVVASGQDLSGTFSDASPLPGGGRAVFAYVIPESGRYRVRALGGDARGTTAYNLELRVFRSALATATAPKTIFVDFDGATLDPAIFGSAPDTVTLSPLSSFLAAWGLTPADEDAVIDMTLAVLRENLLDDPQLLGPGGGSFLLLNSRDHADPFGAPNVSRLILGGTIGELGIPTIGIAQSLDVGNFGTAETGVVLLDLLSGPSFSPDSLNSFPRAAGVEMVEFVGLALGNIGAHEVGHFSGSYHTENSNTVFNLMDQGGQLANTLGLGSDGVFGSADDVDVDFGADSYAYPERFAGVEDTLAVLSCGCPTSTHVFSDDLESGSLERWSTVVN